IEKPNCHLPFFEEGVKAMEAKAVAAAGAAWDVGARWWRATDVRARLVPSAGEYVGTGFSLSSLKQKKENAREEREERHRQAQGRDSASVARRRSRRSAPLTVNRITSERGHQS